MAVPTGRATSITIPEDLCRLLDLVRARLPGTVSINTRTDQKLILWLAREHAMRLLVEDPPSTDPLESLGMGGCKT